MTRTLTVGIYKEVKLLVYTPIANNPNEYSSLGFRFTPSSRSNHSAGNGFTKYKGNDPVSSLVLAFSNPVEYFTDSHSRW